MFISNLKQSDIAQFGRRFGSKDKKRRNRRLLKGALVGGGLIGLNTTKNILKPGVLDLISEMNPAFKGNKAKLLAALYGVSVPFGMGVGALGGLAYHKIKGNK